MPCTLAERSNLGNIRIIEIKQENYLHQIFFISNVITIRTTNLTVMNMAQWSIRAAHFKPRQVPKAGGLHLGDTRQTAGYSSAFFGLARAPSIKSKSGPRSFMIELNEAGFFLTLRCPVIEGHPKRFKMG